MGNDEIFSKGPANDSARRRLPPHPINIVPLESTQGAGLLHEPNDVFRGTQGP